jgi:hypothetical protein
VSVDLVRVLGLLRTHITSALCETVFATPRIQERQQRWTLQALCETLKGSEPLFPYVCIRWQRGPTVRAVLTYVFDPTRLQAAQALALYPPRMEHPGFSSI